LGSRRIDLKDGIQMNNRLLATTLLAAAVAFNVYAADEKPVTQPQAEPVGAFKSVTEQKSYALGVQTARSFKRDAVDVDIEMLKRGLDDGLAGGRLLMTEGELRSTMNGVLGEMRRQEAVNHREASDANRSKGEQYLAANKAKPGVVTLPSGVQYRVIKEGSGPKPTEESIVTCKYRGTRLDGREFDATSADKEVKLRVDQMFNGWKQAVKLMPEGSHWEIVIPPTLAFGSRGVGTDIGPNETLIMDFELVKVK
jgi:FKBP-type peptidyl-prolyl cis-trans isomerase FklB